MLLTGKAFFGGLPEVASAEHGAARHGHESVSDECACKGVNSVSFSFSLAWGADAIGREKPWRRDAVPCLTRSPSCPDGGLLLPRVRGAHLRRVPPGGGVVLSGWLEPSCSMAVRPAAGA